MLKTFWAPWIRCLIVTDRMVPPVKSTQHYWCGKHVGAKKCKTLFQLLLWNFLVNFAVITGPETNLMLSIVVGLGGSKSDHPQAKSHDFKSFKTIPTMLVTWQADLVYLKPRREEELIPTKGSNRKAHQQRTQDASYSG